MVRMYLIVCSLAVGNVSVVALRLVKAWRFLPILLLQVPPTLEDSRNYHIAN